MVFVRKRKGETLPHATRSKGHGRDARATKGMEAAKNMRFCETNPNYLSVKTGDKTLRRSRIQIRMLNITIGFVWHGNDIGAG